MINVRRIALVVFLAVADVTPSACAEVFDVETLLQHQDDWPAWAKGETKLQVTGRLQSRVGSRLHLQKLDVVFIPERGITIPERMRSGRRLSMSGRLRETENGFEFSATRFLVGETDRYELAESLGRLEEKDVAGRYAEADRYARIAEFYGDEELAADVLSARLEVLDIQRAQRQRKPEEIWKLVDPGPGFALPERRRESLAYEVFLLRSKDEKSVTASEPLKAYLPGWNYTQTTLSAAHQQASQRDRVGFYDRANAEVRRELERVLYRSIRANEILAQIDDSGSNGLQLARQIREELPEEEVAARNLAGQYADYRLTELRRMNRNRLQEVVDILRENGRESDAEKAVNDWVEHQVDQFADRGLEGQLRVANEYLFVWDQWKNAAHREAAIDFLKRAWSTARELAPDEAPVIASRLENLGWTRLGDKWLTTEQLNNVPSDDIALAQREGRVVAGMTPQQVNDILGEPDRVIRTASVNAVEEIRVYGERHSRRLIVRLRRTTADSAAEARVQSVFQLRSQ